MENSERKDFAKALAAQSEIYNREVSPTLANIFFSTLSDYSLGDVLRAFRSHNRDPDSGRFFPKPADLVKHLGASQPKTLSVTERAEIAWATVESEISRAGPYQPLVLEDQQAIAAVKHIGGWKKLCCQTYNQLVWTKKDFLVAYDTYENAPIESLPSRLPGLAELTAASKSRNIGIAQNQNEEPNYDGLYQRLGADA